jgi:hypothetical protein
VRAQSFGRCLFLIAALSFAASSAFSAAGCGARSDIGALDYGYGGSDGALACVETTTGITTAAIGGAILHQVTECFERPEAGPCPAADEAAGYIDPGCFQVESVDCGPITKPEACCYIVTEICGLS